MTQRQVVLSDEMDAFVTSLVEGGDYTSDSEVMQHALANMKRQDDEKLVALRAAIDEGFDGGIFEGDAFASVREELGLQTRVP